MSKDGDLRMLGAADGLSHALIWVREQISGIDGIYAPLIRHRHHKRRAARDAILRPLKELEQRIAKSHTETRAAYQRTTES